MRAKPAVNGFIGTALQSAVAVVVIGATSAAFAISFAAIVYRGPLEPHLGHGIGLALLGAVFMGLAGSVLFSYRGTICQPQDVTAILLAGAAASLAAGSRAASGDTLWPTVLGLIIVAPFVTGTLTYLAGRLRAGDLARVIPFPVTGGFLAASGYMLLFGALSMSLGSELSDRGLVALADPELFGDWVPWVAAGAAMMAVTRATGSSMVMPLGLVVILVVFYGGLALSGTGLAAAQAAGLMLGPFHAEGLLPTDAPALLVRADWALIATQAPTLVAIAGLTILGTLLNSTGTEMALERDLDIAQDLRATGLANVAGGLGGGLSGFQLLGATLFATRVGLTGPAAGIAAAAGSAIVLVFGSDLLELLPRGLFAALVSFLGLNLLFDWLWDERRRLSPGDYAIVWLILLVAAFAGFIVAFALGMMVAALVFILSYSRLDVLRMRSTAAERRSRVERGDDALRRLAREGSAAVILELNGYLFFGTADRLARRVGDELSVSDPPARIIVDFSRVHGLDASAVFALIKIGKLCRRQNVTLVFSGMSEELRATYLRRAGPDEKARIAEALDDALEDYEETLLGGADGLSPGEDRAGGLAATLTAALDRGDAPDALSRVTLAPGEVLLAEGSNSDDAFILLSGNLRAEIATDEGERLRVARFQPGALIGEIAYFAGSPRTATILAETESELLCIVPGALAEAAPELADLFHRTAATHLARRLGRTTRLLREAGI